MTLAEARRAFPSYRSAPGAVPARVAARKAISRGFGISYDDVGEGPAVVLVPGFTMSGGDWWELGYVDRLVALGRRVLAVDPLGHGGSDQPGDPAAYRWPDAPLDVVAAMDAAGVDRATLWGYSRGAVLAAVAAAEAPRRVSGLILGGSGDITTGPAMTLTPWVEGLLAGDWEALWATPLGSGYSPDDRRYCERFNDPRAFGAALAGRRLFPYSDDPSRITARSLVYCGGEDSPEENGRTAQALGVQLHVLPGLDHDGGIMAIDQVMAIVEPFLASMR
jgi:pimeloyl-ACP methyl ester carboxylesterase